MIARITFKTNEGDNYVMLFGTSYKHWTEQYREYLQRTRGSGLQPIKYEISTAKWKGWGGLKWCPDEEFQQELNREGVQRNEPDNSNPRQYSSMRFAVRTLDQLDAALSRHSL